MPSWEFLEADCESVISIHWHFQELISVVVDCSDSFGRSDDQIVVAVSFLIFDLDSITEFYVCSVIFLKSDVGVDVHWKPIAANNLLDSSIRLIDSGNTIFNDRNGVIGVCDNGCSIF